MKFERFEDIVAWLKAGELKVVVYTEFSECKDFVFRDQIQRAAIPVMNNIFEGFDRRSNNEFYRFLLIANGPCGWVQAML